MDQIEQIVVSWIASQSVVFQIGLSLALIFLIGPALLAGAAAAVTRIEKSVERLLSRSSELSLIGDSSAPETETESVVESVRPITEGVAEPSPQMLAQTTQGQLHQVSLR
jgi:hypothetical protein